MGDNFNRPTNGSVYDWANDDLLAEPGKVPRKNADEELDEILAVFGSNSQQRRSVQPVRNVVQVDQQSEQRRSQQVPPRVSQRYEQPQANQERRRSSANSEYYEAMKRKSRTSAPSSNKRQKTSASKKWQVAAVSVLVAGALYVGGVMAAPLDSFVGQIQNRWLLEQKTDVFVQEVVKPNTTTTFMQDKQIDYGKIAEVIETDGQFTNEELLITVDALGEVGTNQVLAQAVNPPATDVESYMRERNITDLNDWKQKTAESMYLGDQITETKAELDSIFKGSTTSPTAETETTQTYGGK